MTALAICYYGNYQEYDDKFRKYRTRNVKEDIIYKALDIESVKVG
jgi:hypothetical protein